MVLFILLWLQRFLPPPPPPKRHPSLLQTPLSFFLPAPSSSWTLLILDMDHATVNLARSRDGLTNWERSVENPIVAPLPAPTPEESSWNCDAVYKPFVLFDEVTQQWLVWFNGRCGGLERIGMATLKGRFGKFVRRSPPSKDLWF